MAMHNPPHPGESIRATYMEPFGLSCRYLAPHTRLIVCLSSSEPRNGSKVVKDAWS